MKRKLLNQKALKTAVISLLFLVYATMGNAQNPAFQIASTSGGFVAPSMTAAQKNAIVSPVVGSLIYQTDGTIGYYYCSVSSATPGSSTWLQLLAGASSAVTTFNGGTTGLTPNTASTGAITLAGTLNVGNGGTGLTTLTSNGVLLGNGTSAIASTAAGTAGQLLLGQTGAPTWNTMSGDATLSNAGALTIGANAVDGTNIALGSDAQGDIMYYNGTDWARLAAGTNGQFLKTQGSAANPVWSTDNNSGGTVTSVATGSGLSGGPITGAGTIALANGSQAGQIFVTGATPFTPALQTMSGDATLSNTGVLTIAAGAVANADLTNMAALTVKGNATNASAVPTDIAATAASNSILRESGSTVGFGSINLASSGAVGTSILPVANGGTGSSTQNWVDLTTAQTAAGAKTWTGQGVFTGGFKASGTSDIKIGDDATAKAITIGSTTGATSIVQRVGTGGYSLDGAASSNYDIGASATTGAITIGGTGLQTGAISIGTGTGAQAINLGTGGTGIKTINIGTGAVENLLTMGSTSGAASTRINSGTGGLLMTTGAATDATLTLGTTGSGVIGSSTANSDKIAIKPQSTTTTASFTGTLTSADLTANQTWTLPNATGNLLTAGVLVGITNFNASGNYLPATNGARNILVIVQGGGGGGGGVGTSGGSAGGGAAGGYSEAFISNVSGTYVVTVGGTAAGGVGNAAGTNGNASSFVQTATSINVAGTGGTGGTSSNLALGTIANASAGSGGGAGSGGAINLNGQSGMGGSSYGAVSGAGGASRFGGAGPSRVLGNTAGVDAAANTGSGGSGALGGSATAKNGGAGAAGRVIVYEYK